MPGTRYIRIAMQPAASTVGIPSEITDPVNARILAVSEDRIAGFLADPFDEIARLSGVDRAMVHERLRECSEVQEPITAAARVALVGREIEVLVDGIDDDDVLVGRTHREAPEIDGVVRLVGTGDVFARPGAVVRATVCGVEGPDLDAKVSG